MISSFEEKYNQLLSYKSVDDITLKEMYNHGLTEGRCLLSLYIKDNDIPVDIKIQLSNLLDIIYQKEIQ